MKASSRIVQTLALACLLAGAPGTSQGQEVERLQSDIARTLESYNWRDGTWGVEVRSLDADETLFSHNPDSMLIPASNMKLLTSAAALSVLGPEYRFRTYLLADGPIENGVLHGDLVIFGTGDPGISDRFYRRRTDVFGMLLDQMEEAGVHTVTGDVVADASFFPGPYRDDGWEPRDLNEHFTAPVSALSYNENVVSFRIVATPVGQPPEVTTVPDHSALEIVNTARMVDGRPRPRLAILREDPLEPVRVEGRMVAGTRDVWRQMTVAVPADFAGASFLAELDERGVRVEGDVRSVHLPAHSAVRRLSAPGLGRAGPTILATHVSRPLGDYLEVVNKRSNNLYAELMFRATGRVSEGVGSPEAAALAVKRVLAGAGVDTSTFVQADGSGLSSNNRVAASAFVGAIEAMEEGDLWPEFWASLPQAGTRGELGRMYRTPAARNLRAKTGTIEGVSSLSGMVRSRDGERLAFSLLINDSPSQTRAKRVENLIGARLAEFRRAPADVPTIAAETPPPDRGFTRIDRHQVRRGENLSVIASRYGVTLNEIVQANPRISPNRIIAGQWLDIPKR